MKEIVILSGKGGTGKTSITAAFAALAANKVLADCDVDAADLHLLLKPLVSEDHEFWSGQAAVIDAEKCAQCGLCQEQCRFDAIHDFTVDPIACEGCAFCFQICPVKAITMQDVMSGHWFISTTRYGHLVHARLGIAQENSGKLVALVRQQARDLARAQNADYIISDGPPGIGCPVISSLSGADLAVLVTEPSLSGIHDLERIIDVCRHFEVPALVCINKYDINGENTRTIEIFCRQRGLEIVARLPFDDAVTAAINNRMPLVEYTDNPVTRATKTMWARISVLSGGKINV